MSVSEFKHMNNVIQVTYWERGTIIPSSGIENAVTGHGKLDTPSGDKGDGA